MQIQTFLRTGLAAVFFLFCGLPEAFAAESEGKRVEDAVNAVIQPLMAEHAIPGMAVGLALQGKRYFFYFGSSSMKSGEKVQEDTLFEIGSVSKVFTAVLAAYAREQGALSFEDAASLHLPALAGSSFDTVSLLELGTYTAGGLPLQFPHDVRDAASLVAYCKQWQPAYAPGTHRLYSNPSIGLFGHLAALSLGESFDRLMEGRILPALKLSHTYIHVPEEHMGKYALGYSKDTRPVRLTPALLASEAYGIKTIAADMIQFVEANMDSASPDSPLRRALAATRTGYYTVGGMTQGLGWEMYPYPASLETLLAGNSSRIIFKANKVAKLEPPLQPQQNMLVNKTGSTDGFGTYVAFIPEKELGIVLLANRNYPTPARIQAAFRLLTALEAFADPGR